VTAPAPAAGTRPVAEAPAAAPPPRIRRHVAPAGSPIHAGDLARWAGRLVSQRHAVEALRAHVRAAYGVRECFPISTGRAGMTLLFETLASLAPGRREVAIPAYTCYSVAASAVKAGLRPRLVDVDPGTLDVAPAALAALDGDGVLAIVATNLFGLPSDLPAITAAGRRLGAFVIDDAAQAMGATVGGRASGTWGDAGLYSLDKGKNISAIDGGLLVTHSETIATALDRRWQALGRAGAVAVAVDAAKVLVYAAMLPPSIYWIPRSIPQLGLGQTAFTTAFPLDRMPSLLASLALTMLPRLGAYNAQRIAHARAIVDQLAGVAGVSAPAPGPTARGVYLRLPLLVDDAAHQAPLIEALTRQGIGATGSYPTSLADVPELRPHLANPDDPMPGARAVARRIVTVPTHPYVTMADRERIVATVRSVVRGAAAPGPQAR
jgi:perosamine synthetase